MKPPLGSRRALLEWTRRQLARVGRPRRERGQNFVIEPRLIREVTEGLHGCRHVLEVGSGLGSLTVALASRYRYVLGVEVDSRFTHVLREILDEHVNIDFIISDILEYKSSVECLASNLPFSITGPFFSHLVRIMRPLRAVLTVQKEVAARLAAKPGTRSYGRLTVLVQLVYDVELGNVYPPSSFYPPPEVYSQVVHLRMKTSPPPPEDIARLEVVTRCLFSQRNRLAVKVVKRCCGTLNVDLGERRVYELAPEEVAAIARECGEALN